MLDVLFIKQRIVGFLGKNPEVAKRIFTDESLYGWNFD
jgi:hypothetical protein